MEQIIASYICDRCLIEIRLEYQGKKNLRVLTINCFYFKMEVPRGEYEVSIYKGISKTGAL